MNKENGSRNIRAEKTNCNQGVFVAIYRRIGLTKILLSFVTTARQQAACLVMTCSRLTLEVSHAISSQGQEEAEEKQRPQLRDSSQGKEGSPCWGFAASQHSPATLSWAKTLGFRKKQT